MAGFIYIMSNPAFPNLLKIGKTSKDPTTDRINELNTTGVPYPFRCEYYVFVGDHDWLERKVHSELNQLRANDNREFFEVDCAKAINLIRDEAKAGQLFKYEEVFFISSEDLKIQKEKENSQRKLDEQNAKQFREKEANIKLRKEAEIAEQQAAKKSAASKKIEGSKNYIVSIASWAAFFFLLICSILNFAAGEPVMGYFCLSLAAGAFVYLRFKGSF